jgi:GNAT superfamily N-acetyltransferase
MTIPANTLPSIAVRPAAERDFTAIARLAGELGYPSTPEQIHERFAAFGGNLHQATFVAELNGEAVIGWIHLSEERSLVSEPRAEITGLVVESTFRGCGAGSLLVRRGEEWAGQRGFGVVGVRSNVIRERTHQFYARLGYAETKTQRVFRKVLQARA